MMQWLKRMWTEDRQLAPARAVMHPAWLLAVFVLLINDHMLKPTAAAELLTGKLSDVAGLFFFPVLVAALFGVRTRRALWLVGAAVAVPFAAINLSTDLAAAFDALVSTVVPFATTTDPTDLIALLAIPVGLMVFEPIMYSTARSTRRLLETAAVTLGGLASLATSEPPCEFCFGVTENAQVSLLNKTNELHSLRVRSLRSSVRLDCDPVSEDPNAFLRDAVFGPSQTWLLQSGQEMPVRQEAIDEFGGRIQSGPTPCRAVLIQSDTVPDIIVFWDSSLRAKTFAFDVDVPREIPADDQTVVLDADYSRAAEAEMHHWRERSDCGERADLCGDETLAPLAVLPAGARYFWRSNADAPLHFVRPTRTDGTFAPIAAECVTTDTSDSLAWEQPSSSEMFVVGVERGLDGCHEVRLTRQLDDEFSEDTGWWVCAPYDALATLIPSAGVQKRLAVTRIREGASLNRGGFDGLQLSVVTVVDDSPVSFDTIFMSRGYRLPPEVDFEPTFVPIEGCSPIETACGQAAVPVDVRMEVYDETLRPGESVSVGAVSPLDVFLVRAEWRPVLDTQCENESASPENAQDTQGYIEAVVIRRDAGR